ncbi:serine--tRNA ligase [Actinopolymorpha sp. B17G11]|uniref:serine--tRNA ligase n=1 Tax=Actinopolymorpha sp. B17G11 TaxID=3160861 RepID=UPI0032E51CAA
MIDPKVLREDPDRVRESQRRRGASVELVDEVLAAEERRRSSIAAFEQLRSEQKTLGKQIPRAAGEEKQALLARAKQLAAEVKAAEAAQDEAALAYDRLMLQIDNLVEPEVPAGGEDDYVVLDEVGQPRDFTAEGFEPRDHVELGRVLGAIDIERGAKVSGSRFYYLTGVGALLELALINMAVDQAMSYGCTPMIPPSLVKPRAMQGTGYLGQAAEDVYKLERDDLYLVGTSEVPLAAYHMDEILAADQLPLRYAGFSPSFRREAGSHGKDTRGIIRVHWFDKVEMFSFVHPDEARAEHQRILAWEREFWDRLEVPYRVIDTAAGDLGASAARKFDIEAWIPTQGRYREVTSTSNCTEFQARRLGVRFRTDDGTRHVATLNGTAMATTRTIVAILENHQDADGGVRVPKALQPFLGGRSHLEPLA